MRELDFLGFPNYFITEDGQLFAGPRKWNSGKNGKIIKSHNGKWMKYKIDKDGYIIYSLTLNGKVKQMKAHRLVALAFIPNPENKPFINHLDSNPFNNHISNLEWCTARENIIHAWKNGRCELSRKFSAERGRITFNSKIFRDNFAYCGNKKVINELGQIFDSAKKASISLGFNSSAVSNAICNNHKCGGHTWRYL
jgi:hypothetical protein